MPSASPPLVRDPHMIAPEDPATVTATLGQSGACPPIAHCGKTYRLGHPIQTAKALYEDAIVEAERRAIDTLLRRKWITPQQHRDDLKALAGQVESGQHAWGGPLWLKYTFGDQAAASAELFLLALLQVNHPDAGIELARAMMAADSIDVRLAIAKVVPGFFEWAVETLQLPEPERLKVAAAVAERMDELRRRLLPAPSSTTP